MHYVEGKPIFESTIMGPTLQKHALAAFYKHRFFIQWLILKKWKKNIQHWNEGTLHAKNQW